ncbi:MAG: SBBP repeat-containing protein, partial [Bryobacteraceae bacterium]
MGRRSGGWGLLALCLGVANAHGQGSAEAWGGTGLQQATAVSVDAQGNAWVVGFTDAANFPTLNAAFAYGGGVDAFIVKLDPSGNILLSTYLGGAGDDRASAVGLDAAGNIYVAGTTTSTSFDGVPLSGYAGDSDGFIVKLDPTAQTILYAVAVGGSLDDLIHAMAVHSDGTVFVAGETYSCDLPVTSAAQPTLLGYDNAFVAELNPSGVIVYCTYIGGSANDAAWGIAVDSGGSAWVVGSTTSTNFPLVSPLQSQLTGAQESFVVRLAQNGASFLFSTYFGGSGGRSGWQEFATSVALDSAGNAYVAGVTSSTDFPVLNAWQPEFAGWDSDAFLSSFTPAGTLQFSTYLGGSDFDLASSVAILANGSILLGGYTLSSDFPVTTTTTPWDAGGYNGFVTVFDSLAMNLLYSTYVNQGTSDAIFGVAGGSAPTAVGITTPQDAPGTKLATAAQLTIPPPVCQLNPTEATPSAASESSQVSLTCSTGYAWTVASDAAWLAILSGNSGAGNGTVGYSVAANTSISSRIGTLTIAGQTFTITQAGAALLNIISTHTGNFAQGESNAVYTVTISNAGGAGPTDGTVFVTDTLPAAMTLVSMNGTSWSCVADTCSRSDILGPGAGYPAITIIVSVAASAGSPLSNSVSVSGGGSAMASAMDLTTITVMSIANLSPASAAPGGTDFTLTVNGANFASGATVMWNTTALSTTYSSTTQLTASVPDTLIATAGIAAVTVVNPDSIVSNGVGFPIRSGPTAVSASPGGAGSSQTFTFTFSDPSGWQNLGVVDVLINR